MLNQVHFVMLSRTCSLNIMVSCNKFFWHVVFNLIEESATTAETWVPMDGDAFVTSEGFIFNVFGYEHLAERVFAFLKYIPAQFKKLFHINFLESTWTYKGTKLFRAEKLYTATNYHMFLETFKANFPNYVYFCPFRAKEVISVPIASVKTVYVPNACLQHLSRLKNRDCLQERTLELVNLFSTESKIGMQDFGVHGSVALNMHNAESDIDLVVYGAQNFRKLERTIQRLVDAGTLSYKFSNRLDAARKYKGKYLGSTFMYNGVRKAEEVNVKYGQFRYAAVNPVRFECRVRDDSESMFRPATYSIDSYVPADAASALTEANVPKRLVSMVGCYRNIARKGNRIRVSGMLEQVKNLETGESFYQVVVGTATSEDEHIWPCSG